VAEVLFEKRKIADERRVFQDKWTYTYLHVLFHETIVCRVRNETIPATKECNIKQHYLSEHSIYDKFTGEFLEEKVCEVKKFTTDFFNEENRGIGCCCEGKLCGESYIG
jgi:hypothetical protein